MIRLITTRRRNALLAEAARHAANVEDRVRDLRALQVGIETLARRAACSDAHAAEAERLRGERDQARAIAVDFEQGLAAQEDLITGLRATIAARLESTRRAGAEYDVRIAALTADRDRALAQADIARAAAEAADIPIVDGLDPDEYLAAVKAVIADIAARKKAEAAS